MKLRHFETLRPVCPVCRSANKPGAALRLAHVIREETGHIVEGALHCTNPNCLREFPIVDGIPLIVANIREYVSGNILTIFARRDLSGFVESMLGDCCGPGSAFDVARQHVSSYAWDHYGDLDPQEATAEPRPGSMWRNLNTACEVALADGRSGTTPGASTTTGPQPVRPADERGPQGPRLPGPILDLGCSVGRSAFALAEKSDGLVLGVDLHFAMLRVASEVLRHAIVRYPRRRVGLVYDRREFPARFASAENVDFWACDATALPFPEETFSFAAGMNTLDSVHAPRELLVSLGRALKEGARVVLTCPYDWSVSATPLEAWLGGHSQRSQIQGSPETVLRALLAPGPNPSAVANLQLVAERDQLPWQVRLHDRSVMTYQAHLVVAERRAASSMQEVKRIEPSAHRA